MVATLAFVAAGVYFTGRRRGLSFSLALGAMLFVGALAIQLRTAQGTDVPPIPLGAELVVVTAHVIKEGEIRDSPFGNHQLDRRHL